MFSHRARVQRGPYEAARCASTEDHQAPSPLLSACSAPARRCEAGTRSLMSVECKRNGVRSYLPARAATAK